MGEQRVREHLDEGDGEEGFRLAATKRLRGAPLGLAYVGDDLWFTSAAGGSALHRGGVLTMVGPRLRFNWLGAPRFDPTVQWDEQSWRLATLMYDGLLGFRRAGGVEGVVPVPDLATDLPTPTEGGRTYAFHLRKRCVATPPGSRCWPVTSGAASNGRRCIRKCPPLYAEAIVGAQACATRGEGQPAHKKPRPDCDLRKGITADDRTGAVTLHLTKPIPDFPYQLALPFAFAVPQDTPSTWRRESPHRPPARNDRLLHPEAGRHRCSPGPPRAARAGPQPAVPRLVARGATGRLPGPDRPGHRIPARQAENLVADGRADVIWLTDESLANADQLQTRHGSQLRTSTGIETHYVFLNATKPPFDNRDARRASPTRSTGEPRQRAGRVSGAVTCTSFRQHRAYRPYCPFTLGGDARREVDRTRPGTAAEDLVERSGTRGAKVVLAGARSKAITRKRGGGRPTCFAGSGCRASLRSYTSNPTSRRPRQATGTGMVALGLGPTIRRRRAPRGPRQLRPA